MNIYYEPTLQRRNFLCLGGEREDFERLMKALMALQAVSSQSPLAARHAAMRAVGVEIEAGIISYVGGAAEEPRVAVSGGLSANHQRILDLILKTYRPMARSAVNMLTGKPEGPILLEFVPEEMPGHDRLEAVETLISFLTAHGHSRAEAEGLVQ